MASFVQVVDDSRLISDHSVAGSAGCGNGIVPGFLGGKVFNIPPMTSLLIQARP
jgi:hypothetical protein